MTLEQLAALGRCIAEVVPLGSLRGLVEQHPVVAQFDHLVKTYAGPIETRALAVVERVLEQYSLQQSLTLLCEGLYELSHGIPASDELRRLLEPGMPDGDRREAMLAKRDNFFLSRNLHSNLAEFEPKVCCIVGSYELGGKQHDTQGTGFLVGPDLLLTAMHVFEPLDREPARVPESFKVFFDHHASAPLSLNGPVPTPVRCVRLAQDWRVTGAQSFEQDGKIDLPDPQQQEAMRKQLDFVLVRLNDEVGLQPVSPSGGRIRSWVRLPDIHLPGKLARDERLVITQHPGGAPQCLDFGRFERVCPSNTRIFYSASTAPGSSGAPCFNQQFELVGMHNAKFQPAGHPVAKSNQAIRFDSIQAFIAPHIKHIELPAPARLWNLDKDRMHCRPVIGRSVLLKWIEDSKHADANPRERYFAMVPEAGQGGKSFSWEVLEHCVKSDHQHLTMLFDKDRNIMPATLEDFVATLTDEFMIPPGEGTPMPARTEDDNDKLRRWASQLVPQWFCAQLEATRAYTEDRRARAQRMVEDNRVMGRATDPDIQALANQPEPDFWTVERWTRAWLVFDDLHILTLSQEIQDFVAAIAQMGNSDNGTFEVLRRLRWVFLGNCPAFLDPALMCVESIGEQTYLDGIEKLKHDIMSAAPYAQAVVIESVIDTIKDMMRLSAGATDSPAKRLALLQNVVSVTLTKKMPIWTNT